MSTQAKTQNRNRYREEVEPTLVSEDALFGKRYTHPAYGQISAHRVSGTTTLFGSDFTHQHFISLSVRRAELQRGLSQDSVYSSGRDEVVEVHLSEAQWVELVANMNTAGVACTLSHVMGQVMPSIPKRDQTDVFKAEADERLQKAARRVEETIDKLAEGALKGLSEKRRQEALAELDRLRRDMADSLPFVAKQLGRHMEETVQKAKVEVEAYIGNAVRRAGLQAIAAGPLQLSGGTPDDGGTEP